MVTTTEYAQLSAASYDAGGAGKTNANWIRTDYSSLGNGFYAATFENTKTHEVVIAYRGTNGPFDVVADIQLVAGQQIPQQFFDARKYYDTVIAQSAVPRHLPCHHVLVPAHRAGAVCRRQCL